MNRLCLFRDTLVSLRCHGGTASFEQLEKHIAHSLPKLKHLKYWLNISNDFLVRFYPFAIRLNHFLAILVHRTIGSESARCEESRQLRL
jgi:hypothetical protein